MALSPGLSEAVYGAGMQLRNKTCLVRCSGCRLPMYIHTHFWLTFTQVFQAIDCTVAGTRVVQIISAL